MKKLKLLVLILLALTISAHARRPRPNATLVPSCIECCVCGPIWFTGSGYTPGNSVFLSATNQLTGEVHYFWQTSPVINVGPVAPDGTIVFSLDSGELGVGIWTIETYDVAPKDRTLTVAATVVLEII